MLHKKMVEDIDVRGKRVFVRCDFNVPIKDGVIQDDNRIRAALKTIEYLKDQGAKIILASHLGKPKGYDESLSLRPVSERLSELLGVEVKFLSCKHVICGHVIEAVKELKDSEIILLENTRFSEEETKNGDALSKKFAELCDIFVNDAFGTAHRAHASNVGITNYVDECVAGYLVEKELNYFDKVLSEPERPYFAIMGGAKVSDKIKVIENLFSKVDGIIIGGAMAFTFMKAQGYQVAKSLVEDDYLQYAKDMIEAAGKANVHFLLPVDYVAAKSMDDEDTIVTEDQNIPEGYMGLDIGPKSVERFREELKDAKTVIWNGPMGVFEKPQFAKGTNAIVDLLSQLDAVTIIGGGDSASAVAQCGAVDKMSHISTGGGASLELLEGKVLPGVDALSEKE